MPDIVVTVPKTFGLADWIAEGDAAGDPYSGELWDFSTGGATPNIKPGERVYVVCHDRVRGYAPLVEWKRLDTYRLIFTRGGGAVAVTVPWADPCHPSR